MGAHSSWVVVALAVSGALACVASGPALVPLARGQRAGVVVETRPGLSLTVEGDAWAGEPQALGRVLTPVKVTIRNTTGSPMRVQYRDFSLAGSSGTTFTALPPLYPDVERKRDITVELEHPPLGFAVADYLAGYHPTLPVWRGILVADPDTYRVVLGSLATRNMLQKALPEGVLQDGGEITGFLFFPRLDPGDVVTFHADLVVAPVGRQLAVVDVPFRLR
jgi:hypothetical protein